MGLCSAWLVSVPLTYAFTFSALMRFIGIRARDVLAECGAPAVAAALMYAAVAALRWELAEQPAIAALGTLSVAGALVYLAIMLLISRSQLVPPAVSRAPCSPGPHLSPPDKVWRARAQAVCQPAHVARLKVAFCRGACRVVEKSSIYQILGLCSE